MPRKRRESGSSPSSRTKRGPAAESHEDAPALARGVWSGSISFGLVTIPVELFSATRQSGLPLRLLAPDGTPLARRYACSADERALSDDEIARGYEFEKGKFVLVTDEELEQLAPRRSRDIELTRFVARDAIDPVYFVRPYFVLPDAEHTKAYRLLAQTMEASQRAALATFVMRGKAYAVALFADRGVLRAATLRFGDELRSPKEVAVPATRAEPARVAKLRRAIATLARRQLDERELTGDEAAERLALARAKLAKNKDVLRVPEAPARTEAAAFDGEPTDTRGEVIDLFALIQQRLRDSQTKTRTSKAAARSRPRAGASPP